MEAKKTKKVDATKLTRQEAKKMIEEGGVELVTNNTKPSFEADTTIRNMQNIKRSEFDLKLENESDKPKLVKPELISVEVE